MATLTVGNYTINGFTSLPKDKQDQIMLFLGVYYIEDVPSDWRELLGLTHTGRTILKCL